jgi:DNA-binding NarL/FixJ family response regulator
MSTENIRVLIVDNDEKWSTQIADALRHDSDIDFAVTTAISAPDAEDKCKESTPHIALVDLSLTSETDTDGLALLKRMRERWHHVKTVLITAHSDIKIPTDAFAYRPDSYLEKPQDLSEAISSVRKKIMTTLAESKDFVLSALESWSLLHNPDEPIFSTGGRDYTVADLQSEIRKDTKIGHLFREALATVSLEQLQQANKRPSESPREIIEGKLADLEDELRRKRAPEI